MEFRVTLFEAFNLYWHDPSHLVLPAGDATRTIAWLQDQTPETWHKIACSWNYDADDAPLTWILTQPDCDRGTAAQVFLVEGLGHWLSDAITDPACLDDVDHVCNIVLRTWPQYRTGTFHPTRRIAPDEADYLARIGLPPHLATTPVADILSFTGLRAAVSPFACQDGKIVRDFDLWLVANNITIG